MRSTTSPSQFTSHRTTGTRALAHVRTQPAPRTIRVSRTSLLRTLSVSSRSASLPTSSLCPPLIPRPLPQQAVQGGNVYQRPVLVPRRGCNGQRGCDLRSVPRHSNKHCREAPPAHDTDALAPACDVRSKDDYDGRRVQVLERPVCADGQGLAQEVTNGGQCWALEVGIPRKCFNGLVLDATSTGVINFMLSVRKKSWLNRDRLK